MKQKDNRKQRRTKSNLTLNAVQPTDELISSRAGLSLIMKFCINTGIFDVLQKTFSHIKKNKKGFSLYQMFLQVFAFMLDGTSKHVSYFDHLKTDPSHSVIIGTKQEELVSSQQVRRFFYAFSNVCARAFRLILYHIFIELLNKKQPSIIILGLDSVVLDNAIVRISEKVLV